MVVRTMLHTMAILNYMLLFKNAPLKIIGALFLKTPLSKKISNLCFVEENAMAEVGDIF